MATRPYSNSPWPAPTSDISPPTVVPVNNVEGRSMKRRKLHSGHAVEGRGVESGSLAARQIVADQTRAEEARRTCQVFSGNEIISCYPTGGVSIPQHQWATFVWNSRRPELTQLNLVNIFLFRADSKQEVLRFTGQPNPSDQAGFVTARVDDRWFGPQGETWEEGRNVSYPFYWVIIRSDATLDGNEIPQSTFSAIQTTYADSVMSSRSSASLAAASSASILAASLSSVSSLSAASLTATRVTTIEGTPTTLSGTAAFPSGFVQSESSNDSFPRWAIAVIVVLGFLAIAATCVLAFLILRRIRRRNQSQLESHRNSMGSASPMMAHVEQQQSPGLPPVILPTQRRPDSLRRNDSHTGQNPPSVVLHDGESGISAEGGPFSGADAAIMADAFRKMLRKPDFAAVQEGDGPESNNENAGNLSPVGGQQILSKELAEEGRDIRSVGSSRGVRVESHTDGEHRNSQQS